MISLECRKCGNRQKASADSIIEGMQCGRCNTHLRLDDGSAGVIYDSVSTLHYEYCPKCKNEVACEPEDPRPMIICPECDRVFVHTKKIKLSVRKSDWDNEAILRAIEKDAPAGENPTTATINSYDTREIRALKLLGVYGAEQVPELDMPLIQSIFDKADKELIRLYPNYPLLPDEIRLKLCLALARTPQLNKFYFGGQCAEAELADMLSPQLDDKHAYEHLCRKFPSSSFQVVRAYVKEFTKVIYEVDIDEKRLNYIVFMIFCKGMDEKIKTKGFFVYYSDNDLVRPTSDLSAKGRKFFYEKENELNHCIRKICTKCGLGTNHKVNVSMIIMIVAAVVIIGVVALYIIFFMK